MPQEAATFARIQPGQHPKYKRSGEVTRGAAGTRESSAAGRAAPAEDKPAWQAVPRAVRAEVERQLGARVQRAVRTWGGYAPSATFRLAIDDGRSVFLKAAYPLPAGSPVQFVVDREERVYRDLHHLISPWAPSFSGSFALDGWHALLLEDVGPPTVPPWTPAKARAAMESYGAFHRASFGASLPRWLSLARRVRLPVPARLQNRT